MTIVLQQDLAGGEWLEKKYPTLRMPKYNPRLGSFRWERYTNDFMGRDSCISAMFFKGPVDRVCSEIASCYPGLKHFADIGFTTQKLGVSTLSEHRFSQDKYGERFAWQWLPHSMLLFRLKGDDWCMAVGLLHPPPFDCRFPRDIYRVANRLHRCTGLDVVSSACRGTLELYRDQEEVYVEYHQDWDDDGAPSEWFEERGFFVPPYRCDIDDDGNFHFWLAEVSINEVERIDLFLGPKQK